MQEKYSLNEQTLEFIREFEKNVDSGKTYDTKELVDIFIDPSLFLFNVRTAT